MTISTLPLREDHVVGDLAGHVQSHNDLAHYVNLGDAGSFEVDTVMKSGVVAVNDPLINGGLAFPRAVTLRGYLARLETVADADFIIDLVKKINTLIAPSLVGSPVVAGYTTTTTSAVLPTGAAATTGNIGLIVGTNTNQVTGSAPVNARSQPAKTLFDFVGGTSGLGYGRLFGYAVLLEAGDGLTIPLPALSGSPGQSQVHTLAVAGADWAQLIDAVSTPVGEFRTGGSQASSFPITSVHPNTLLLAAMSQIGNTSASDLWTGITEQTDHPVSTSTLSLATGVLATAGAAGTITATPIANSNYTRAIVALCPLLNQVLDTVTIPAGDLTQLQPDDWSLEIASQTVLRAIARQVGGTAPGTTPGLTLTDYPIA